MRFVLSFTIIFLMAIQAVPIQGQAENAGTIKDQSLSTSEYEKLGMPSIEKDWTMDDWASAVKVVGKLKNTPEKLPRYKSPTSGKVFAKLTDRKTIDKHFKDNSEFQEMIGGFITGIEQCLKQLNNIYGSQGSKKTSAWEELSEVYCTYLYLFASITPELKKFEKNLKIEDPNYSQRLEGLTKIRNGFQSMLLLLLNALVDKSPFSEEARTRISDELAKRGSLVVNELSAGFRAQYRTKVESCIQSETNKTIKENLRQLLKTLKSD